LAGSSVNSAKTHCDNFASATLRVAVFQLSRLREKSSWLFMRGIFRMVSGAVVALGPAGYLDATTAHRALANRQNARD